MYQFKLKKKSIYVYVMLLIKIEEIEKIDTRQLT